MSRSAPGRGIPIHYHAQSHEGTYKRCCQLRFFDALTVMERLAPGFRPEALALVLQEHGASTALMLVGNEPDFSRTMAAFTGGGRVDCREGCRDRVDIEKPTTLEGALAWLLPPEALAPCAPTLISPGRILPIGDTPRNSPGTFVAGISRPRGRRRRITARRRLC